LVAISHVSGVTNTQGFIGGGNYTGAIVTAVGTQTRVCDALVAISHVALVTNTQGFIGGGNHAGTKAAAIDVCTG
jgi:adhesin HecA-like repeat protein